jgi:chromatin segregation and condensation protein Rec8/ScpA/Scc1 (kleisin family)
MERKAAISALGVVSPPPIHVSSPSFDGSLALLFTSVRERKIDLQGVPLFPVCEAYFEYLITHVDADLDEAASALSALAFLLERKAWGLLPTPDPEPEQDEPLELVPPSVQEYEAAIEALKIWHSERERRFFRVDEPSPDSYEVPVVLGEVSAMDLARAFERLLKRAQPEPMESPSKARKSLSDMMGLVLKSLSTTYRPLENLIEEPFTRSDAVYWFLALLELIRLDQAKVKLENEDVMFARAR